MAQVIGVRFREVGKVYYFDPLDNKFEKGDHVIVETVRNPLLRRFNIFGTDTEK